MADNTETNPGSGGDIVASDDISGVKYQRIKVIIGDDGVSDGDVSAANPLPVDGSGTTQPVSGTFWQATQPVSGTVTANIGTVSTLATAAKQDTGNTSLASIDGKITAVNTGAVVVSSSALPSGAATSAKQPALGTAGTASADVITVQGKASMTPLLVDGSGATQPISGTVTAAQATATNLKTQAENYQGGSAVASGNPLEVNVRSSTLSLATSTKQSDGTQKTQVVDGSGNVIGATSNALDINIKSGNLTTLPVTNAGTFAVQTTPTAPTTIYNGKKTVTTAGTRVTLAASQAIKSVVIKALVGNTGVIYVGDSSVASTNGFALSPGDSLSLDIANLNTVNLDSSVNGEGVTYAATN